MLEYNKIYLGDFRKLIKLIPNDSIDFILTDPPYNCISDKGKKRNLEGLKINHREVIASFEENFDFEKDMLFLIDEFNRIGKEYSFLLFFWNRLVKTAKIIEYATKEYKNHVRVENFVWLKTNPYPNINKITLLSSCEHCTVIQKKKGRGHFNYLDYNYMHNYYISSNIINDRKHSTQKPIQLINKFIRIYTQENDVVLDPFIGSGTTAIACIQNKRNFIGFEINKNFYDIANKRIEDEKAQFFLF